ncbi:MAG: hypothetical protein NVSMB59_22740 [Vulcanimicrobiaceae bacterium]
MIFDSARMMALLGSLVMCLFTVLGSRAFAHVGPMRGLVLATLPTQSSVVVRYDAMAGKPAGVATFRMSRTAFARVRAGMRISAVADVDSTPWTLASVVARGSEALTGAQVPVATPKVFRNVHHVAVGEYAPNAEFVDQRGRRFTMHDLRGQTTIMAFAYTRCRDKRECPLITSRFRILQQRFAGQPVHLVEVSLDPAYDRPGVLAAYGRAFGADARRWSLATGDPERVLDFAAQFDVTAFEDERVGLIHPERLVIIDAFGAIRELVDEGAWTPGEVVSAVAHDRRLASNPIERLDLWLSAAAVSICGNGVASFSGFTDLLTVIAIALFFGFVIWRVGRGIARGTV